MSATEVAIVGAGPYGLSLAAHLASKGIEHRIFGQPMEFWTRIARAGRERYLKSFCFGTNISIPAPGCSFPDYNRERGRETFEPCSMANFAEYGMWVQQKHVPWVEPLHVTSVAQDGGRFTLGLSNGAVVDAARVVIATGLSHLEYVPAALTTIADLVTHTANVENYSSFAGRDVAVIGSGQSALEAAALLNESGARPVLLARDAAIRWMSRLPRHRSAWQRLRYPVSQLAVGPKAWVLANFPGGAYRLPDRRRLKLLSTYLPPEGAWWLRDRVEGKVPIRLNTTTLHAEQSDGRAVLHLAAGGEKFAVDHVIAGTGYRMDVRRIAFLASPLRDSIRTIGHAPRLSRSFESSIPGLYFAGPIASACFGPLFRFVAGAEHAAKSVATELAQRSVGRFVSHAWRKRAAPTAGAPEIL